MTVEELIEELKLERKHLDVCVNGKPIKDVRIAQDKSGFVFFNIVVSESESND